MLCCCWCSFFFVIEKRALITSFSEWNKPRNVILLWLTVKDRARTNNRNDDALCRNKNGITGKRGEKKNSAIVFISRLNSIVTIATFIHSFTSTNMWRTSAILCLMENKARIAAGCVGDSWLNFFKMLLVYNLKIILFQVKL